LSERKKKADKPKQRYDTRKRSVSGSKNRIGCKNIPHHQKGVAVERKGLKAIEWLVAQIEPPNKFQQPSVRERIEALTQQKLNKQPTTPTKIRPHQAIGAI
jgi:hypothetical protein